MCHCEETDLSVAGYYRPLSAILCSASELIMRTESLLVSSPQKSGRHDVTLNSASHSVVRIPPRHSGPAYDVVAILDPATRAAQKYTPVIMVSYIISVVCCRGRSHCRPSCVTNSRQALAAVIVCVVLSTDVDTYKRVLLTLVL